MARDESGETYTSFLGTGWGFPPEFVLETGQVRLTADEEDIQSSLRILFGTARGERLFEPDYGLSMRDLLFEPMGTTMRSLLAERVKLAVLIYEPRIDVLSLEVESPEPDGGSLKITLAYEVRATNSRYNLVFPFYLNDANEVTAAVGVPRP